MKKVIVFIVLVTMSVSARADLSWAYGSNLLTWDSAMEAGWLVQMYQDVSSNSVLSSINAFDALGTPTGTGASDDQLLNSFVTTLQVNAKTSELQWGVPFASWSSLYSDSVYSVIYNASSIGGATLAVVVDASPFTLPSADPGTYSLSSVNNSWVAVPEPATFLLFAMGGFGAWLIRRKNRITKEEV